MTNRLPELGDKVKCKVTGFAGIVTSYSKHISGCDRLYVDPPVCKDGHDRDGKWVDIDMISIIKPNAVDVVVYNRKAPGGADLPASK